MGLLCNFALTIYLVIFVDFTHGEICLSSVCEYTFEVRWAHTMAYRPPDKRNAYNLDMDGDRLRIVNSSYFHTWDDPVGRYVDEITNDVITADGVAREVITINGQFPGPAIEVAEGSQVVVHVKNKLFMTGVTIHWHGISQLYTSWMDGAAFITQCPIQPGQSFTYRFFAKPAGTHWYHSHLAHLRMDGLYGAFIVHKSVPELPEIPVIISDWFHLESKSVEMNNAYSLDEYYKGPGNLHGSVASRLYSVDGHELNAILYQSGLINGRGRFDDRKLPLTTFNVEKGKRYRLRLICAAAEFPFEVSIDNHKLWVVGSDGTEVQPLEVTSVVIHPGETIDIEMEADQSEAQYWMRARIQNAGPSPGIVYGERPYPTGAGEVKEVKAIFRYENTISNGDPTTSYYTCSAIDKCKVFNCPFAAFPTADNKECIPLANAFTPETDVKSNKIEFGLDDEDFLEYFFNFGFNWGSSINGNKFVFPDEPFSQIDHVPHEMSCDKESCASPDVGCVCRHVKEIPFNKTIQMVLTNFQPSEEDATNFINYMMPHPVHIHGHNFAVVKMGFAEFDPSTALFTNHNPDILCSNSLCKNPRWNGAAPSKSLNLENPPIKNTVVVPAKGYIVIRFRSTNPGYWGMHCHTSSHHMEGMNMIFKEAPERISLLPQNFQTCKNFLWSSEEFESYKETSSLLVKSGIGRHFMTDEYGQVGDSTTDCDDGNNEESKENKITVEVKDVIGFGVGCIAIGAILVLLPLCIYMGCQRSNTRAQNENN